MKKYILYYTAFAGLVPCLAVASDRPNIILINIDDLGWTDMSNNGSQYYEDDRYSEFRNIGFLKKVSG